MEADTSSNTLDDLLAHAGWVRSLATRLLGDAAAADDVVQDTWLAALRRPPRRRDRPRPWLGRVVRNAVQERGRSGARRRDREHVVAGERGVAPSSDELAEQVESQRRVAACVLELGEPYRQTVLLRYFEDLSSAEIARRLDVPEGTVRWRLKQGLDELRRRLDDGYGSRRAWCLALAPLVRRDPLLASGATASGGAVSLWHGLLAMNLGLKLALLATAALVAAYVTPLGTLAWESATGTRPAVLEEVEVTYRPSVASREPSAAPAAARARRTAVPATPAAAQQGAKVTLEVLDQEGRPVAGAMVGLSGYSETDTPAGQDGKVTVGVPEGWNFAEGHRARVLASAAGYLDQDASFLPLADEIVELGVLVLAPAGGVAGRVVDAFGQPVAGAKVCVGPVPARENRLEEERIERSVRPSGEVETDGRGDFLLAAAPVGEHVVWAALAGHEANCSGAFEIRHRQVCSGIEVRLGTLDSNDIIHGVVLDPAGRPVPRAQLTASYKSLGRSGNRSFAADAEGRFRLAYTPRAPHTLRATDPERRYAEAVAERVEGSEQALILRLREARTMVVEATAARGDTPLLEVTVWDEEKRRGLAPNEEPRERSSRVRIVVPEETFWIEARAEGFDSFFFGPFEAQAAPAELGVELTPLPGVRGRVLYHDRGVPGVTVTLRRAARQQVRIHDFPVRVDPGDTAEVLSDVDGSFALTLRESGRFYLRAEVPDHAPCELGPLELDKRQGLEGLALRLTDGGSIEGRVLSPDGEPVGGTVVAISRGDGHAHAQRVGSDGRYRFDRLLPGPWQVERHSADILAGQSTTSGGLAPFEEADLPTNCLVVEGELTHFDLAVEGAPTVVAGRLLLDGEPPKGWAVQLAPVNQGLMSVRSGDSGGPLDLTPDGGFELVAPAPGTYRLQFQSTATGKGIGPILSAELELGAGVNPWTRDLATGTVLMENPGPVHELGIPLDFVLGRIQGVDVLCPVAPDPDGEAARLERLPAGSLRVVRFTLEDLLALTSFPTTQPGLVDVLLTAGGTVRVRMP